MCECVYLCMLICMYVCIYACVNKCVCMYTCNMCMLCMGWYVCVRMHDRVYMHVHVPSYSVHAYMTTESYVYTHLFLCIWIYICTKVSFLHVHMYGCPDIMASTRKKTDRQTDRQTSDRRGGRGRKTATSV